MITAFSVIKLHPLTKTLLEKRGIVGDKTIEDFLFPNYKAHISDPFLIHGMKEAVERIMQAFKNNEKIAIYSDYDCDGIPGGVLLRTFFDEIGYPVDIYVPHRHNEGYGVHIHAIDALKKKGITLVITVDLAITNIEEIAYAKSVGVDFIVTDHHLPVQYDALVDNVYQGKGIHKGSQIVPDAVAVINSKQDVCTYPDDMLCGCAVAWKLCCAVLATLREDETLELSKKVKSYPEGWEKWMLDLVGISTIADMVPLQKENRALAHFGLKVLRKTKRPGLLHIFNEQRVRKDFLTEDDIAFTIAPRINAASRMGDPIQAHRVLYEKDVETAEQYARELEDLNTERKAGVKDIVSGLSFDHDAYKNDVIVVGDMSWGPGILGLIAQKIIDETGKPVFVWGMGGEDDKEDVPDITKSKSLKGSCRSRGDVNVVDLMVHVGHDVLTHWGGHEQAGGFSLLSDNIDKLSPALNEAIKHVTKKEIGSQKVQPDTSLTFDEINDLTYKAIEILAPYGVGNPKPIFEFKDVEPLSTKWFGKKNEHFEITYPTRGGGKIKAIQFFAPKDQEESSNKTHTLLAHVEKSYFAGRAELRLRIVEIR